MQVFESFRSKVLSSFRRIKKDMSLISKTSKNLSKDIRMISRKISYIDPIRKDNQEMRRKLAVHSKILQKMARQKSIFPMQNNVPNNFSSKITGLRSELKTEIEGIKYELSKSSENSYQAYSDSIIVQREIDYLKKENRLLKEELSKKQDVLSTSLSGELKDISKLRDVVFKLSESVAELKKSRDKQAVEEVEIRTRAQRQPQITIVDEKVSLDLNRLAKLSADLETIKSRINSIERNSSERGPILAHDVKTQKTIFSFGKMQPLVKMFTRKSKKKDVVVDYDSKTSFERSGNTSASLTYMPQAWSRIEGYKKVEKKKSSYSW